MKALPGNRVLGRRNRWRSPCVGVLSTVLPLGACIHVSPIAPAVSPTAGCERFFAELDALTELAGARDAGSYRLPGSPYLRSDRFLASFRRNDLGPVAQAQWLERLRALDAASRRVEIANLGQATVARAVFSPFPGLEPEEVVGTCGRQLVARDLTQPERVERLKAAVTTPDAYSGWHRMVGLYPLTRLALEQGVAVLHRRLRAAFAVTPGPLSQGGQRLRYAPPARTEPIPDTIPALLARVAQNPLAIPDPRGSERRRLFETFAPVWEIEALSSADRIGAVEWRNDGLPTVRVDSPVVYRFVTHTRFRGESLLQLNYLIWFPRRPAQHWLDIYAGDLDGLIWRVTLDRQGAPLAYDSIHPCGCYYQVFPGLGYRVQQPALHSEPVLSPAPLLPPRPGQRLVLRISAGEHYLQAVYADTEELPAQRYAWREHEELLAMRTSRGSRRSLFGPDGLVPHTQRIERFLLWPSGVPSPGAMRRIGTHAIALVGRRHFDDADLLDSLLRPL